MDTFVCSLKYLIARTHFTEWVTVRLTDSIIYYYVLPFPCAGYASLYKNIENAMPILYKLIYYVYDVYSVSSLFLLGCALQYIWCIVIYLSTRLYNFPSNGKCNNLKVWSRHVVYSTVSYFKIENFRKTPVF